MFAEKLKEDLHNCLKCGMCQPVCPTFQVTRMERYAPRGRVQMVRHYLEGDLSITTSLREAIMSCILCEACSAACPSGVRLDRVFVNMRRELHESLGTGLPKKALFATLKTPLLMRLGARIAHAGMERVIVPLNLQWRVGNIPLTRLPRFNHTSFRQRMGEIVPAKGRRTGRVLYFTGCATDLMNEDVGAAVVEVLTSLGIEVLIPQDQVCCAVPIFLSGAREEALPNILRNLTVLDRADVDAIVVDCATCGGGLVKGIPQLLDDLGLDTEQAWRVAGKVRDVTEIVADRLEELEWENLRYSPSTTVTYHDPCHLKRSMKISGPPRNILSALQDVTFKEMTGSDQCCGGAGAFQFEHAEISVGVTARKKESVRATSAALVATGCPGCRLTLAGNLSDEDDPSVVHTIQLVADRLRKKG